MSDSEDSTVTYTAISSPFRGLSDIGSSGVDGPPVTPEDSYVYVVAAFQVPPSPNYVPGPEELEQAPLSPEFVHKLVYPEFMPPENEVFPAEEQLLPAVVSPTADSPGSIADSDPEEDEEDPKEDPKEDPIDYPTNGGDDDGDDDESFDDDEGDDDDDDVEEDKDEEEEEEHPAPVDSVPPLVYRVTARMSVRAQRPISFPSYIEVARLLAMPTPPPSLLSPFSSPLPPILSPLPQILSPPLPVSSPPLPASPTYPLGYIATMIWLRVETRSTSHPLPLSTPPLLPIPLPTPSPPLLFPLLTVEQVGESSSAPTARPTGGFRADYGFVATLDDEIRCDPERDVGYGITDTWDEMLVGMLGALATDDTELGRRMTEFATMVRQDTYEIYGKLDAAQDDRLLMSGRLNMLHRDKHAHARTILLMEREARLSREAWGQSIDASNIARSKVKALRTAVLAQHTEIAALRAADRSRQAQLVEILRLISTLQT
ncbi:hypothetical protein Tco_1459963 [Tanacetum coccineum]